MLKEPLRWEKDDPLVVTKVRPGVEGDGSPGDARTEKEKKD